MSVPATDALATASFSFEGAAVRTITRDGEPWFVAADVCQVLDHGNARQVVSRLDDDEKDVLIMDTLGGRQQMTVINEAGLYLLILLILTSRKPEAKAFKRWITAEVIPAIRKTGSYAVPAAVSAIDLTDRKTLRAQLLVSLQREDELEEKVTELEPKAQALARMSAGTGESHPTYRTISPK